MPKLSVQLVSWNGAKYVPYLFESLRKQTYKDWELLVIDNNSTKDNTANLIEKELCDFPVPARLIRNKENNGFAGGHNQATQLSAKCIEHRANSQANDLMPYALRPTPSEYIQLLNQDMYLAPDYLEKVVAMMDSRPQAGAGQGVLLRWNLPSLRDDTRLLETSLSDVIDTMGLKVMRNRRVVDWKTGEILHDVIPDRDRESRIVDPRLRGDDKVVEVFGVSGALPIYRRKSIEDVMFEGNMFDDEFGSYKEDVDLAFRLRSAGWKAYVDPEARAWHDRTAAGPREMTDQAAMQNRKGHANYVNYYSYRNHLMVLLKNEQRANFAKDWPWIIWYELKKLVFIALFDRTILKGLREIWKLCARIMAKRAAIMANYKVQPEEMRRWFM